VTRVATGVSVLALAALAGIMTQVLVRDDHDNAYLYLLGAGLLLLLPCLVFVLATLRVRAPQRASPSHCISCYNSCR
jgi:hypothetical protein